MRKNRLMWNIAVFLTIIISIPIAYAQIFGGFTGSSLFLILINSLIVGVILFILQTFLIPQKNPKEQTAVWVAIIVGSLLIGWFFGSQGIIWNHPVLARFFSIYVLVNTLIIGVVLYFISGFLDINKKLGGSPEGKGGLGILIFLIAAVFAVQIGNQFIWHQAVVKQFIDYLFGAQGILNPAPPEYRLWAFLAVTTLLYFFFNGFLLKGGAGGTNKVNYALAILIGSSVARAGISFASIVLLGEAIFTIVLADALKGTAPNVKGFGTNWILAAFLVGWASAAMTYGTDYQGWLAWIVGTPLWAMGLIQVGPTGAAARPEGVGWFGWILKMGIGALLIIGLPILFFGFVIGRGEKRKRLWEGLTRLRKEITNFISRHKLLNRILGTFFSLRDPTLENEIPFKLKEMRFEIYTLMNLMLRYDIYYTKLNSLRGTIAKIQDLEEGDEKEKRPGLQTRLPIRESPAESIKTLVEGSSIVHDPVTGTWNLVGKREVTETGELIETQVPRLGIGRQHWLIYRTVLIMKELLQENLTRTLTLDAAKQLELKIENFKTELKAHQEAVNDFYERRYKSGFVRFGIASVLRSQRLYFLDMYNMYGKYKRGYFFARPGAIPDLYVYETRSEDGGITQKIIIKRDKESKKYYVGYYLTPDERRIYDNIMNIDERERDDSDKRFLADIENKKKQYFIDYGQRANYERGTDYLLELDLYGYCLSEWNAIAIDGASIRDIKYIRRFRKEDMWEIYQVNVQLLPTFGKMFGWSLLDWENYVADMGKGKFHPWSKKLSDYDFISEKGLLDYTQATFKGRKKPEDLAFDREGLKAFHNFVYWGRRNYYDPDSKNLYNPDRFENPYPSVSLGGLWGFIKKVAIRKIEEPEIAKRFLQEFQLEYEQLDVLEKGGEKSGQS